MARPPFYSETERGAPARTGEIIDEASWRALHGVVDRFVTQKYFAQAFPVHCLDSSSEVVDTDIGALIDSVEGLVPTLRWNPESKSYGDPILHTPATGYALDALQAFYRYAAKPKEGFWHSYMQHHHLSFDSQAGRDELRADINEIFARRGIAYELQHDGTVIRLGTPIVREALVDARYDSGNEKLDGLLETARTKYFAPDPVLRKEALEALWDAFERLKTLEDANKRVGVEKLLAIAFPSEALRERANVEMQELTLIGNSFDIRHHETRVTEITDPEDIDYLFGRMYSLMHVLLAKSGRLAAIPDTVDDAPALDWLA